jgi:hypothetical protein
MRQCFLEASKLLFLDIETAISKHAHENDDNNLMVAMLEIAESITTSGEMDTYRIKGGMTRTRTLETWQLTLLTQLQTQT